MVWRRMMVIGLGYGLLGCEPTPSPDPVERACTTGSFHEDDLVSDEAGVARIQDPTLVGAWGIAVGATGGAFWVAANGSRLSDLYSGDVNGSPFSKVSLVVALPGAP